MSRNEDDRPPGEDIDRRSQHQQEEFQDAMASFQRMWAEGENAEAKAAIRYAAHLCTRLFQETLLHSAMASLLRRARFGTYRPDRKLRSHSDEALCVPSRRGNSRPLVECVSRKGRDEPFRQKALLFAHLLLCGLPRSPALMESLDLTGLPLFWDTDPSIFGSSHHGRMRFHHVPEGSRVRLRWGGATYNRILLPHRFEFHKTNSCEQKRQNYRSVLRHFLYLREKPPPYRVTVCDILNPSWSVGWSVSCVTAAHYGPVSQTNASVSLLIIGLNGLKCQIGQVGQFFATEDKYSGQAGFLLIAVYVNQPEANSCGFLFGFGNQTLDFERRIVISDNSYSRSWYRKRPRIEFDSRLRSSSNPCRTRTKVTSFALNLGPLP